MDIPSVYEIRVEGHLTDRWADWFEGLAIRNDRDGETTLSGLLVDQAALFGALAKLHDLSLILISVQRLSSAAGIAGPAGPAEKAVPNGEIVRSQD
jgi:hypothetical protein